MIAEKIEDFLILLSIVPFLLIAISIQWPELAYAIPYVPIAYHVPTLYRIAFFLTMMFLGVTLVGIAALVHQIIGRDDYSPVIRLGVWFYEELYGKVAVIVCGIGLLIFTLVLPPIAWFLQGRMIVTLPQFLEVALEYGVLYLTSRIGKRAAEVIKPSPRIIKREETKRKRFLQKLEKERKKLLRERKRINKRTKKTLDQTTAWFAITLLGLNLVLLPEIMYMIFVVPMPQPATLELPIDRSIVELLISIPGLVGTLGLLKQVLKKDKNTPILKSTGKISLFFAASAVMSAIAGWTVILSFSIACTALNIIAYTRARRMKDYYLPAQGDWLLGHKIGAIMFFGPIMTLILAGTLFQYTYLPVFEWIGENAFLLWALLLGPAVTVLLATPVTPVLNRETKETPMDLIVYTIAYILLPALVGAEAAVPTNTFYYITIGIAMGIAPFARKKRFTLWVIAALTVLDVILALTKL